MKDFIVIFILFLTTNIYSQYLDFELGRQVGVDKNTMPQRMFFNGDAEYSELIYDFNGATYTEHIVDGKAYQFLHIEGFEKMGQVGAPALPARNEIIAMPRNSVGEVIILDSKYYEYSGFMIHPALKPAKDTEGAPNPKFEKDSIIYNSNNFFPDKIVEIVDVGLSRGTPLAKAQIRPIQFNPVTGIVRVYTKIRYRIEYKGGERSFDYIGRENTLHYTNLLKLSVLNSESIPNGLEKNNRESAIANRTQGKNYIIITHSEFLTQANEIANWKRQMGYSVEVVSQSSWTAVQVKSEIQTRYDNWTPKPDYFLIIGDHDGSYAVPGEIHQTSENDDFATDLYYACMDGSSDWHPDMAHGRISVSSSTEAEIVVNKVINYEKIPPETESFYSNMLSCAQYQDDDNNGYADRRFCHTSEEIRDYMQDEQSYISERVYYTESTADVTTLRYNNESYSDGQLLPAELRSTSFDWDGGSAEITSAINNGKFLVFHRDHGYAGGSGWAHPYYTTSSMTSLSNGENLPVVFSMNCHTGEFQVSNCFAEKFIRMENKGAVGVVAAAYYSYSGYNDALSEGMIDAIWADPGLYPDFGTGGTGNNYTVGVGNEVYTMGDVVNQGLYAMEQNWNGSSSANNYQYELFHWFGDPAMKIWTSNPNADTITATHSSTIDCDDSSFAIVNSMEGAKATLVYNDELIGETILDASGNGSIAYSINNPGTIVILTISKHNHKPYTKELPLTGDCGFPPSVETETTINITDITATANGNILDDFGDNVTESGFVYSQNPNPEINGTGVTQVVTSPTVAIGQFSIDLVNLSSNTQYYLRAYATNANGVSYGEDDIFKTNCGKVNTFPYTQNFDSWTISSPEYECTVDGTINLDDCWENVVGDDIDWDILSGATGSGDTGPNSDYSGNGNYLYTESSSCYNSTGYIQSVNFDLTQLTAAELQFYYHMYGSDMGSLSVQVSTDNGTSWSADLWNKTGDQGNLWLLATVSLNNYINYNNVIIRFKAITGSGYTSDIAIDEFSIVEPCSPPTQQATNLFTSDINDNDIKLNWTRGNGDNVIVIAKENSAVDENPHKGISYTANSEFAQGEELGSGNYVVYIGSDTNVTITSLNPGTSYHFAIYEFFDVDNCYLSPGLIGDATTSGTPICSLCNSTGNTTYQTSTTSVSINTLVNTSAKPSGYSDYTNLSTELIKDNSYDLNIKVNTDGNYTTHTFVWIDWNKDCDFDDIGEEYDLGEATNVADGITSNSPKSITIPSNAYGNTKMRVSTKYNANPTSCETSFDGEVEDYTLIIKDSQHTWLGYTNDWNVPSNWENNVVPDSDIVVIIPTSPIGGNFPIVSLGTTAECQSITFENGAAITIEGILNISE